MSNTNNKEPNTTDDLDTMERKGLVTSENLREVIEQGRQTLGVDNWEVRFDKQFIPNDGSIPTYIENGNDLKAFIHQELQKARHDWLREEIVKLGAEKEQDECIGEERKNCPWCGRNMYCRNRVEEIAHNETLQTIIDRYQSELDQPLPDKQ